MYDNAQSAGGGPDTLVPMKPKFTDQYRYLQGYVRADATDVAKTWAVARSALEQDKKPLESNVRHLNLYKHNKTAT